jgi:hypothetical protein
MWHENQENCPLKIDIKIQGKFGTRWDWEEIVKTCLMCGLVGQVGCGNGQFPEDLVRKAIRYLFSHLTQYHSPEGHRDDVSVAKNLCLQG